MTERTNVEKLAREIAAKTREEDREFVLELLRRPAGDVKYLASLICGTSRELRNDYLALPPSRPSLSRGDAEFLQKRAREGFQNAGSCCDAVVFVD